jgi:hypothetical protein
VYEKYKAKHHSMSLNKWRKEIEERFEIEADGITPAEKMEDAIDQIEDLLADNLSVDEVNNFIKRMVLRWYKIGAIRGAAEMLKDLAYYYDILPDDEKELKNELSEPIENDDFLFWKANLKYKSVGNATKKTKKDFSISYKRILRKYSNIS